MLRPEHASMLVKEGRTLGEENWLQISAKHVETETIKLGDGDSCKKNPVSGRALEETSAPKKLEDEVIHKVPHPYPVPKDRTASII